MGKSAAVSQEVTGVFRQGRRGGGVLLDPVASFRPSRDDVQVPEGLQKWPAWSQGRVAGAARAGKDGLTLNEITSICDWTPDRFKARTRFEQLTAVDPSERFRLEAAGDVSMRGRPDRADR